ncbi:uncharacterized protein BYT42DRAFT_542906 [Radiomyces spectabilis]|uniref:uncharacterized protein n=1 Tax=Radiomyces spectabilis TaxID=64574 RepID=UPI00221F8A70|nr:uncharacterized protein BYT42DRAFT_542906 [Radiomyces spectabilis]KAI8391341.1 hypothetical protein BYT42DRAFT_542906 [Radiomyces spectabilis]
MHFSKPLFSPLSPLSDVYRPNKRKVPIVEVRKQPAQPTKRIKCYPSPPQIVGVYSELFSVGFGEPAKFCPDKRKWANDEKQRRRTFCQPPQKKQKTTPTEGERPAPVPVNQQKRKRETDEDCDNDEPSAKRQTVANKRPTFLNHREKTKTLNKGKTVAAPQAHVAVAEPLWLLLLRLEASTHKEPQKAVPSFKKVPNLCKPGKPFGQFSVQCAFHNYPWSQPSFLTGVSHPAELQASTDWVCKVAPSGVALGGE